MTTEATETTRGVCRICGCTYFTPCEGGCSWADDTNTLCTSCVAKGLGVSADDAKSRLVVAADVEGQPKLLEALTNEMLIAQREGLAMEVNISAVLAFQMVGLLQLALRHPKLSPELTDAGTRLVMLIEQWFASPEVEMPAAAHVIRLGHDQRNDVPIGTPVGELEL